MRGADLSLAYYEQVVRTALERHWTGLPHAAGRLGAGSDVLGLDDHLSRDHDWGLRLTVLLDASDAGSAGWLTPELISRILDESLPDEFDGHPTRFSTSWDRRERHRVEVTTVEAFVGTRIGVGTPDELDPLGWLALTGQSALEVTAGPLFHDGSGTFTRARRLLATYPRDVRLQVLAAGW